ncbi:dUTP diphosphatase [Metaclostridioides mangenotii]|uniref:dUTP diphosphatase n=1 Tax=Metaclostridioides mangenotii TaxID=1540 RepID=UPI000464B3CE|nr:deoxyuridine 5'-triphosphate nucleotidohydrolase [Clostridioides mangenotii]
MNLKIKYFDGATKLKKIEKGNWIDVYARQEVFIPLGEYKLIPLGFALELPKGYEGIIAPRSSTFKTWGCIQPNSIGVIDDTYIGDNDEWHGMLYCLQPKDIPNTTPGTWTTQDKVPGTTIRKGDKIAQFRIQKSMPEIIFEEVDKLENSNRGGFGTTGSI